MNVKDIPRKQEGIELEQFTDLYQRHAEKIYSLAYRMCGNSEDAQDIVQNTFLLAIEKYSGFRGESTEYTWLYAIARNLCLKLLQSRRRSSFKNMSELIIGAGSPDFVDESFSREEIKDLAGQVKEGCLLGLVRCLSFYQRAAFILHILMEIPIAETAKILDKSESAVRTLVFRAKKNIKAFLCKNCSLYDPENPCRCENLISFSLKQGWIKKRERFSELQNPGPESRAIEKEIYGTEKLIRLYRGLPGNSYHEQVRELIFSGDQLIFSNQKVK